jgi:PAS domain-containing protein
MANLAADIDDRLRALERELEQLAEDRQRYADLFAFAPDACLVTDVHGTILEANDAADALLEGRGALRGQAIDAFVPMEQRRMFQSIVGAAIAGCGHARFPGNLRLARGDLAAEFAVRTLRRAGAGQCLVWQVRPAH